MMQPKSPTRKAGGTSRAKLYIRRHLGWMNGYPRDRETWVVLPEEGEIHAVTLDRDLLRRSTRAINRVLREFPRALPRLVGDTDRWASARRSLLETLKPVVHDGRSIPIPPLEVHPFAGRSLSQRATGCLDVHSELRPLFHAAIWMNWTDPDSCGKTLNWLARHSDRLERLLKIPTPSAIPLILRLRQLSAAHGDRRLEPVVQILSAPEIWRTPLERPADYGERAAATLADAGHEPPDPPARSKPELAEEIHDWVFWLSAQDKKTQRRGLELFDILVPIDRVDDWRAWWDGFERAFSRARRLREPQWPRDPIERKRRNARARLRNLAAAAPPAVPSSVFALLLRVLPAPEHRDLYRIVTPALRRWPTTLEGATARMAVADHWFALYCIAEARERATLLRLIPAVTDYLDRRDFTPQAVAPWRKVLSRFQRGRQHAHSVDDSIVDELASRERLRTFFAVLDAQTKQPAARQLEHLVGLAASLPTSRVADAYASLLAHPVINGFIPKDMIRFAGHITKRCPEYFAAVLERLVYAEERYDEIDKALRPVVASFESRYRTNTLVAAILHGGLSMLVRCAFKIGVLRAVSIPIPRPVDAAAQPSSWLSDYPDTLRPMLTDLLTVDDNARETARRILSKDFPQPQTLRREIRSLAALADPTASQAKRLSTLRSRLEQSTEVSPKRLENLAAKLTAAAHRALLDRWRVALDERFTEAFPRYLGITETPAWLAEEGALRPLLPIPTLDPSFQKLAKALLIKRCQPPPWDLRDEPANRRFVRRMRAKGLDLAPWLDGREAVPAVAGGGGTLLLKIERDPLEVFRMGAYFSTCLAPGAFNYFSVFANAADINKQVVFARDRAGTVCGRMLIALTDEGGLLTFHPYARSKRMGFDDIARDFAHRLAADMGTVVVRQGRVSSLVASDWYDDGPFDLTRRHPALADGSPLRARIPEIAPERLVALLSDGLHPLPLNELTLPLVLSLPEIETRPELALALLPLVRRFGLPEESMMSLGRLLVAAGAEDEVRQLANWLFDAAVRSGRDRYYWPTDVSEFLLEVTPAHALNLVRRTRPTSMRRWADEVDGARLMFAARASERLGRRKKAVELYRLALKTGLDNESLSQCRQALKALGARAS